MREESQEKQEDDDEWRPNEEQFVLSFVDVEGFVSLMIHCDVVNIRNLSLFAAWLRSDAIRTLISKMLFILSSYDFGKSFWVRSLFLKKIVKLTLGFKTVNQYLGVRADKTFTWLGDEILVVTAIVH